MMIEIILGLLLIPLLILTPIFIFLVVGMYIFSMFIVIFDKNPTEDQTIWALGGTIILGITLVLGIIYGINSSIGFLVIVFMFMLITALSDTEKENKNDNKLHNQ